MMSKRAQDRQETAITGRTGEMPEEVAAAIELERQRARFEAALTGGQDGEAGRA